MRVLVIKMSSMGDILHTLPALTDAAKKIPNIQFDWVVEQSFAEIPAWHPRVNKVIPIAFRRLRKTPFKSFFGKEWRNFLKELRQTKYDLVIDAQGLLKSAFINMFTRGKSAGLDYQSAREGFASIGHQKKITVNPNQHAVTRMRELFAKALDYSLDLPLDYGISATQFLSLNQVKEKFVLFFHGTTWQTKLWPVNYWKELAHLLNQRGLKVFLTFGNEEEKQRAEEIAKNNDNVTVLSKMSLKEVTQLMAAATAIVSVDTGLGHVAAALSVPTISLYGPTDAKLTGTMGNKQTHLQANFPCAPCLKRTCTYQDASDERPACFVTLPPALVLSYLEPML